MIFLIDRNLEGYAIQLLGTLVSQGWLELFSMRFMMFDEADLAVDRQHDLRWVITGKSSTKITKISQPKVHLDSLKEKPENKERFVMEKVRGVWLTNVASNVLDSKNSIIDAMKFLAETGFNVVFPVVWNKGFTLYRSKVMEQNFGSKFKIDPNYPNRDPLQEIIDAAKSVGLKVIPWFEYGFASSALSMNQDGTVVELGKHILRIKPQWAAIDHNEELLIKPLVKHDQTGFKWMNALNPEVQAFMRDLILEVVKEYDVDGIQGDDRLPAFPVEGFDQASASKFKPSGKKPEHNDINWMKFRAKILTDFLADLSAQVKAIGLAKGKNLLVSMAPHPRDFGFTEYLQDTKTWIEKGLVDIAHPQLYRRSVNDYQNLSNNEIGVHKKAELSKISPGILLKLGDFRIDSKDLQKVFKHNRSLGVKGAVFFFFEGLREPNQALAQVLRDDLYSLNSVGDEGPDVIKIQHLLKNQGFYSGEIHGVFDSDTDTAVINFQKAQGFSASDVDGIVGPKTLEKLGIANLAALGSFQVS